MRAGLELALVAGDIGADHGIRADADLLHAVLVFDRENLAVDAGHDGIDGAVRHGRAGAIPRPEAFAGAALRFGKDHHLDGLLAAVRLRHCAGADEYPRFHIGEGRWRDPEYLGVVGELHRHVRTFGRLDNKGRAVDAFDRSAHA